MPIPGFAARRDANEQDIIEALEAAGASVKQLSLKGVCDLLVGIADIETGEQRNYLIEVKAPDGKLTPEQFEFFETWRGQCDVARTVEEALRIIGR